MPDPIPTQNFDELWSKLEARRPLLRQPGVWNGFSSRSKASFGQLLREACLVRVSRWLAPERVELLEALLGLVQVEASAQVDGLAVSPIPSARFSVPRFVDRERLEPARARSSFASPQSDLPGMVVAFVDPLELSFRTFENIIPLDRWFERCPLDLSLGEPCLLDTGGTLSCSILASDGLQNALLGLDTLGLYVSPLNAKSRGGVRFIFHSARLSEALGRALREAMSEAFLARFSHVNPVFRCNRFEPGDDRFHQHVDTPYFDRTRRHVSRYTVLLYLTGGHGAPALHLGSDVVINTIEAMTCVIFDQRKAHEGSPFVDGRKVFLRTELIFEEDALGQNEKASIGQLFARACYLTGERLFLPELGSRPDTYFNQVAEAHWRESTPAPATPEPFVHKSFRGLHWLANGYDFWFPKNVLSLVECAALVLLDFFNCKVDETPFRSLCEAELIEPSAAGIGWIPAFLAKVVSKPMAGTFKALDREKLFPAKKATGSFCCAYHSASLQGDLVEDVVSAFKEAQQFARERLRSAPITLMGQSILLDPAQFVVQKSQIHVLSRQRLAPVNFAACQVQGDINPSTFLGAKETLVALQPLVPPILFVESEAGYHLMFDFFRNSWTLDLETRAVPIPKILDIRVSEHFIHGAEPWKEAVRRAQDAGWIPGELPPPVHLHHLGEDLLLNDPSTDPDVLSSLLLDDNPLICAAAASNPNLPMDDLCELLTPRIDFETTNDARSEKTIAAWQNPMTPVAMLAHPERSFVASAYLALLWLEHLHAVSLPLPDGLDGEYCNLSDLESRVVLWFEAPGEDSSRSREHRVVRDFARHLAELFSIPWASPEAPPSGEVG